jgi:hypothetical protein
MMVEPMLADASAEKRLFIELLTRDIPLVAAFLDLIDNSINAALEPYSARLTSAADYLALFADENIVPSVTISLTASGASVAITDTAAGISAQTAQNDVFKFGRGPGDSREGDRLSVYGIGLKRAMFKLGNKISMRSDHVDGGFALELNVATWAADPKQPWTFTITPRQPVAAKDTGTSVVVTDLYDEVKRRLADGVFEGQLRDSIARTYAYYMAKFVNILTNGEAVDAVGIEVGSNHTSETFNFGAVSCAITAGIGASQAGAFRDKGSGWFVFCNGRAVISADKTALTGWGGAGLPIFQPKHRPFLGTVFFVSEDPEQLPWTTTKSGINEDSAIWQIAKRHMSTIGRVVVAFLDSRYSDDGTDVASRELQEVAGAERVSVLSASVGNPRLFQTPSRPAPTTTRIQYDAQVDDVRKIASYLKRPSMSGSDVGRHTFQHFLRNEVEDE